MSISRANRLDTMSEHRQILGQLMNAFEIIWKEWLVTSPRLTISASIPTIHYYSNTE